MTTLTSPKMSVLTSGTNNDKSKTGPLTVCLSSTSAYTPAQRSKPHALFPKMQVILNHLLVDCQSLREVAELVVRETELHQCSNISAEQQQTESIFIISTWSIHQYGGPTISAGVIHMIPHNISNTVHNVGLDVRLVNRKSSCPKT